MKIGDFDKVGTLMKERDYLRNLAIQTRDKTRSVRVGALDLRPDLTERARPALISVFEAEIARVDADLVALGVDVRLYPEEAA